MRNCTSAFFGLSILVACVSVAAIGAELPSVSVEFSTGRKMRATLDPKTTNDRLWLRFGSPTTAIRRSFEWPAVVEVRDGERMISKNELVQTATAARQLESTRMNRQIVIEPSLTMQPTGPVFPASMQPAQVASVCFDALLGNWDADVAVDGMLLQVLPVDAYGEPVGVRGTLTVELYSTRRVDQNSIPNGRGRDVRLVGQWSTQVTCDPGNPNGNWIQLPFQATNPELDNNWAPYGLVHVQFAAAGHGVFYSSIDGLRIRPYAPLRDTLQQKSSPRFLPSERS